VVGQKVEDKRIELATDATSWCARVENKPSSLQE